MRWCALLALGGCDGPQSALAPDGPSSSAIAELYWVLTAIATTVSLAVVAALLYALVRRRRFQGERPPLPLAPHAERSRRERLSGEGADPTASDEDPLPVRLHTAVEDRRSLRWVLLAGVLIPLPILTGALIYTLRTQDVVEARGEPVDLTIEVIGWRWWWEVHYLDARGRSLFETANEIHIPVGKRVRVRLRSADVIHSFWVPQLAGKLDMIPGRVNQYTIQADEPGVYRGQCAEYCAGPHALMAFLVFAEPEERFAAWAAEQAQGEAPLTDSLAVRGREVFLSSACSACHAVRGTPAVGNLGPDLTHVASRQTLAAVTIPNTRGHLGGWLSNPQRIKPDVNMPAVPLESEAFLALLHYMQSLR